MTEIAEYIAAPLNTATGVVKIVLTDKGTAYFEEEEKILVKYFEKFIAMLTEEEEKVLYACMGKLLTLLKSESMEKIQEAPKKTRRITIE